MGNHAVGIADFFHLLAFLSAAILVLDGETEAGSGVGRRSSAELDVLENQATAVDPGIGNVEFALHNGFGAVG